MFNYHLVSQVAAHLSRGAILHAGDVVVGKGLLYDYRTVKSGELVLESEDYFDLATRFVDIADHKSVLTGLAKVDPDNPEYEETVAESKGVPLYLGTVDRRAPMKTFVEAVREIVEGLTNDLENNTYEVEARYIRPASWARWAKYLEVPRHHWEPMREWYLLDGERRVWRHWVPSADTLLEPCEVLTEEQAQVAVAETDE